MPSFGEINIFNNLKNDIFIHFQGLHTRALILNLLKIVCTFRTKIFYLVNNYVKNGKKQQHQEVGDRYVRLNIKHPKSVCTFHNIKYLNKCTYFSY